MTAAESTKKDKKIVGAAAAVGLILGGIKDGKKGAAKGAATGAAAGAGIVLGSKGNPVELAAGSELDFTLTQSVRVTLPRGESVQPEPELELEDYDSDSASPGVARR